MPTNRHPYPVVRFKKKMARILYDARSTKFNKTGNQCIKRMFKQFDERYHNIIADEYPAYVEDFMWEDETRGWWLEWTKDRKSEDHKRFWWLETAQVREYLQDFHKLPRGQS